MKLLFLRAFGGLKNSLNLLSEIPKEAEKKYRHLQANLGYQDSKYHETFLPCDYENFPMYM